MVWTYFRCISQIAEDLPDVEVTCDQELTIYEEKKNAVFAWIFDVQSKVGCWVIVWIVVS